MTRVVVALADLVAPALPLYEEYREDIDLLLVDVGVDGDDEEHALEPLE